MVTDGRRNERTDTHLILKVLFNIICLNIDDLMFRQLYFRDTNKEKRTRTKFANFVKINPLYQQNKDGKDDFEFLTAVMEI